MTTNRTMKVDCHICLEGCARIDTTSISFSYCTFCFHSFYNVTQVSVIVSECARPKDPSENQLLNPGAWPLAF